MASVIGILIQFTTHSSFISKMKEHFQYVLLDHSVEFYVTPEITHLVLNWADFFKQIYEGAEQFTFDGDVKSLDQMKELIILMNFKREDLVFIDKPSLNSGGYMRPEDFSGSKKEEKNDSGER